jgi:hypothetical protein
MSGIPDCEFISENNNDLESDEENLRKKVNAAD